MLFGLPGERGDGDHYKETQLQHRVSTMFFLYKRKSREKLALSPIFVIIIFLEAGVRFEVFSLPLACWSFRIPDVDVTVWQVRMFSPYGEKQDPYLS